MMKWVLIIYSLGGTNALQYADHASACALAAAELTVAGVPAACIEIPVSSE